MFSSTNNIINPFAHLPSSSYHPPTHPASPPPPLLTHDNHLHDLQSATTLLPANPQLTESLTNMVLLNNASITEQHGDGGFQGVSFRASDFRIPLRKPVKIGRPRKICTAHGVRVRRLRLSIEIAREFFDLQDKLGFDEASKTLEWLFSKSKNAIRDLVKMKHGNGSSRGQRSLSSSRECEVVADSGDLDVIAENGDLDGGEPEGTSFNGKSLEDVASKENMKKLDKATDPFLAKESRAKARARARQRTREKMCTKSTTTNEWEKCADTCHQFLNKSRSLTQFDASNKSDHSYVRNMESSFNKVVAQQVEPSPRQLTSAPPREIFTEENAVIKRKLKPSTILTYHQNLAASKDVSCSSSGNNC